MARKPKLDILEWTVTDAPDDSEIEALPPSVWDAAPAPAEPEARPSSAQARAHHFHVTRRIWLILGTVIVASLLGAGLYTLWNQQRIRGEIERFVAAEEQAALTGDVDKIRELTSDADRVWLNERITQVERYQAAPMPLSILWALPEEGRVQSLHSIASDTVQVDVARKFGAPDGTAVQFSLPQFYRYANGEWQRIAPPATLWGEEKVRPGLRVIVSYYPVDEEFAVELSDTLERILAQACAGWACPDDLKLYVRLSERTASGPSDYASPLFQGSLLTSLFYGDLFSALYDSAPTFASPHALGYPADAASAALLKRAIALEVLTQAAHRSAPDNGGNGFLYALVERMAVRLELEPPRVAQMYFANSGLSAEEVWNQNTRESPYPDAERLRTALAILNRLLQDQPADTDIKLFNSLSPQPMGVGASEFLDSDDTMTRLFSIGLSLEADPAAWLSKGLGIPFAEAKARLRAATEDSYPAKLLTTDPREFTLTCPDGLAVMSRGDAAPTPLISAYLPDGVPIEWSPDGKRLMLMTYATGQWAVVDFEAGALIWPPRASQNNSYNFMGWASDTIVAYQTWSSSATGSNPILNFFDLKGSRRIFPQLPPEPLQIYRYVLSPDKSRAALILQPNNRSWGRGLLALMPPLGGSLTSLDGDAFNPVWSPSGDVLAYLRAAPGAVSLYLAGPTTVMTREVWSTRGLDIPFQSNDVQIVWSPTGDLIALTSNVFSDDSSQSWIILVRPDGSGARLLPQQEENVAIYPAGFSADGKYLAVLRYGPRSWWFSATLIYDAATSKLQRTLPNTMPWWLNNAWSPAGHEMVVSSYEGVYLLAEPGDPNRPLEKLTDERCYGVMWNPK